MFGFPYVYGVVSPQGLVARLDALERPLSIEREHGSWRNLWRPRVHIHGSGYSSLCALEPVHNSIMEDYFARLPDAECSPIRTLRANGTLYEVHSTAGKGL